MYLMIKAELFNDDFELLHLPICLHS